MQSTASVEITAGLIKFSVLNYVMCSSLTEEAFSHTSSWEIVNYYRTWTLQRISCTKRKNNLKPHFIPGRNIQSYGVPYMYTLILSQQKGIKFQ